MNKKEESVLYLEKKPIELGSSIREQKFAEWDNKRSFNSLRDLSCLRLFSIEDKDVSYLLEYLKSKHITFLKLMNLKVNQGILAKINSSKLLKKLTFNNCVLNDRVNHFVFNSIIFPSLELKEIKLKTIPKATHLHLHSCNIGVTEMNLLLTNEILKTLVITDYVCLGNRELLLNLSLLTKLTHLKLRFHKWSPDGFQALLHIHNLTTLDLSDNNLDAKLAYPLFSHPNLTSLLLRNCLKIDAITEKPDFSDNIVLKSLDLGYNSLTSLWLYDLLLRCPSLTKINLALRHPGSGPVFFTEHYRLETLNLSGYKLDVQDVIYLSKHPKITDLNLSKCGINNIFLDSLSKNRVLKKLDLSGNDLGDPGARVLCEFSTLTHLKVRRNKIKEQGAFLLAYYLQLIELDLSYNLICDWGLIALACNKTIEKLSLLTHVGGMNYFYLRFFLGNQALRKFIFASSFDSKQPEFVNTFTERNLILQDKFIKQQFSELLPNELVGMIQEYTEDVYQYPYRYQLFYDQVKPTEKNKLKFTLLEIKENIPLIYDEIINSERVQNNLLCT